MRKFWRTFSRADDGVAAIEFALAAPVVIVFIVGIIEIVTAMTVNTFLEGGLREASRYGVTGGGGTDSARMAKINQIISDHSYGLIVANQVDLQTKTYASFSQIGDEEYSDSNGNGSHDNGEPYVDRNGNGAWDPDGGTPGLGTGGQIVVYRVSYDWHYLTGLLKPVIGEHMTLKAAIATRNEPF